MAIPQAIEWSLATPKMSAVFPSSSPMPVLRWRRRGVVPRIRVARRGWRPRRRAGRRRPVLRLRHPDVVEAGLDDPVQVPPSVAEKRSRIVLPANADRSIEADFQLALRSTGAPNAAKTPVASRRTVSSTSTLHCPPTSRSRRGRTCSGIGASGRPSPAGRSARDVTVVRPPSTSFASALTPAASAGHERVAPGRSRRPAACGRRAVEVGCGAPRCHRPAVAVSVPSALTFQPRATSRSSSNAPQRAIRVAAPRTASGQPARSISYRTASLLRPVSGAISESASGSRRPTSRTCTRRSGTSRTRSRGSCPT